LAQLIPSFQSVLSPKNASLSGVVVSLLSSSDLVRDHLANDVEKLVIVEKTLLRQ
jgi:hypothetical protein